MNFKSASALLGGCLIGLAALWSVFAARLSANLVISVLAEFASYWLALFAVFIGAYLLLRNQKPPAAQIGLIWRSLCVGVALLAVVLSWHYSDDHFLFWKMKAILPGDWPKMASDLEAFGGQVAHAGNTSLPATKPPPMSLRQLGLGTDYSGGVANVWDTPQFTGVSAVIMFGYKSRSWGLLVGPEERARSYCRGGTYFHVATNAFFFMGPRD